MVRRLSPARKKPFRVGLTGNFGAGKSTVARFFREMGARVLSADRLAHEVYGRAGLGRLDRKRISRIVFRDPKKRRALERLIHPYVFARIREEVGKTSHPVVVVEVPLLFESGFHRQTDRNVVVTARAEKILARLRRRGYEREEIKACWRAQMPILEKIRRADYLIDNSGGLSKTREQVVQIWKKIERSLSEHGQRQRKQ